MEKEKGYSYFYTLKRQLKSIKENKLSYAYFLFFIYAVFSGLIPVASTFFTKIVIDLIQGSGDLTSLIISVAVLI